MPIHLPVRYSGGVAILTAPDAIAMNSACDVRGRVAAICDAGHPLILIDCEALVRIDSFGLGELVAAYTTAARRDGALKLLHVGDRLARLLAVARLDDLLESHADERTAIASFRSASNSKARTALDGFLAH